MTAACVYIAAREAKIPRKIEDIGEAFDMTSEVEVKELKGRSGWLPGIWGLTTSLDQRSTSRSSTLTLGSPPRFSGRLETSGNK